MLRVRFFQKNSRKDAKPLSAQSEEKRVEDFPLYHKTNLPLSFTKPKAVRVE
jgi:hypothetical protein